MSRMLRKILPVITGVVPIYNRILGTQGTKLMWYLPLNDSSGTVAKNAAPYRADITNLECVPNPGFEVAGNAPATFYGWSNTLAGGTIQQANDQTHGGGFSAKLTSTGGNTRLVCGLIDNQEGATYNLSIWTRGDGTNQPGVFIVRSDQGAFLASSNRPAAAAWNQWTTTFTVPAGYPGFYIWLQTPTTNGAVCWFDDISITNAAAPSASVFDGRYYGTVTLAQPGLSGQAISLDAGGSVMINRPALISNFPAAGSVIVYGTTTAAALTDGASRWILKFKTDVNAASGTNYVDMFEDSGNNKLGWQFCDDTNTGQYATTAFSTADTWFSLGMTWSAANGAKFYKNGVQVGPAYAVVGTWTKPFDLKSMAIGAQNTLYAAGSAWKGKIQHAAMWDAELTAAEILHIGKL